MIFLWYVTTRKKILHEVAVDRMSESLKEYIGKKEVVKELKLINVADNMIYYCYMEVYL